jgi:hypothetical protein
MRSANKSVIACRAMIDGAMIDRRQIERDEA